MNRLARAAAATILALVVGACASESTPRVVETVQPRALELSVGAEGEIKSARAVPLKVPGSQWAARQLVWMLPEGSRVRKGEVVARFTAQEGELQLSQALIDLQRNALARAAKDTELETGQGRVSVDLAQVAVELGIANRYSGVDLDMFARNEVLDAVQDAAFLGTKQDTLQWKRDQATGRGAAELAVLGAQRATYDINARTRQEDLDALELRAPNDGVLMLEANWTGEKPTVGSNYRAGFEFGSLPDTASMEIELSVPQMEAQALKPGARVEMHPVGRPDQAITSELSWVASAAKVRSRQSPVKYVSMKASIPVEAVRRHGLVPGQWLQARIVLLREPAALSVPNIALSTQDGRSYVQVLSGDETAPREVTLGVRGPARSQVLAGLEPGEQVLLADPASAADASADADADADTDTTTGRGDRGAGPGSNDA